jgi:hypothetical protein
MRWLAWLFTGTTCLAGYGGPLPEIKVGTSRQEMVIHGPPRLAEAGLCQTFLVGTVTEVSAEEDRQPQRIKLAESCTLHVESAYGYLSQVGGIQTAVLKASYEQSPYVPIEEDWGKLWHFKKGQKLIVMLHLCEGEPCFNVEELMVLNQHTASLPDILRRTALLPEEFTDEELEVLKQASQFLHQQFLSHIIGDRTKSGEVARLRCESPIAIAGFAALVVLGIFIIRKVLK